MNYPYFGQTGQGATSVPPSTQPANVQQVTPQQNPQFLMNNQQFQGNQLMPVAKPAYITCSPYAAAFGMPTGCGCQSSCGCC